MKAWRLMQVHHDGTIRSDYAPAEALDPDGVFTARCDHDHQPPHPDCSCGVYVTAHPAPLIAWLAANEHRDMWAWMVLCGGVLAGPILDDPDMPIWPQIAAEKASDAAVVRCHRGAQFTVTAIHHDPRAHHLVTRSARRYGIPLNPLEQA